MVEAYAKGLSLEAFHKNQNAKGTPIVWHPPGDGYSPKPGDEFMANRKAGGHISIVASCESEAFYAPSDKQRQHAHYRFMTLDGKSSDFRDDDGETGWNEALAKLNPEERKKIQLPQGKWQGVAQNKRSTDEKRIRSEVSSTPPSSGRPSGTVDTEGERNGDENNERRNRRLTFATAAGRLPLTAEKTRQSRRGAG